MICEERGEMDSLEVVLRRKSDNNSKEIKAIKLCLIV